MRYHITLMICLIAGLMLAACAKTTETPQTGNPQTPTEGTNTAVNEPTPTGTQTEEPEVTEPTGEQKSIKDLLTNKAKKYTVNYDFEADGEAQTMTMMYDAPKFANQVLIDGEESRMIFDGASFIICSQGEEGWTCFKSAQQNSLSQSEQFEKQATDEDTKSTYVGSCTVAGEKGMKFEITSDSGTSTTCVTSDGILLEIITPESTMTATKVSRTVDEGMFKAPVDPIVLGGMPTQ